MCRGEKTWGCRGIKRKKEVEGLRGETRRDKRERKTQMERENVHACVRERETERMSAQNWSRNKMQAPS